MTQGTTAEEGKALHEWRKNFFHREDECPATLRESQYAAFQAVSRLSGIENPMNTNVKLSEAEKVLFVKKAQEMKVPVGPDLVHIVKEIGGSNDFSYGC